ncbi:MAG: methyltransferase domain-containing protein [Luteitalea sp.]|nr:methyltransferase domain-containing protein [Luteitalea sp.]
MDSRCVAAPAALLDLQDLHQLFKSPDEEASRSVRSSRVRHDVTSPPELRPALITQNGANPREPTAHDQVSPVREGEPTDITSALWLARAEGFWKWEDLEMARMELESYRRTVYEIAQAIAPGWERQRARIEETVTPVRDWMVTELAPRSGDTVLELAAGAGDTGFEAAAIVGETGRLISTDVSPAMVEVAGRRGTALGLANVDYRVMDAEHIELEDDSVDGVLCRFGYMLVADPAAALSETRRVLRPGRRLALSVWGAPEGNPWITILARMLVKRGHMPPPKPSDPDPFSMASEERTRALLEGAGFATVRTEAVSVRFAYRDVDDFMSFANDTAGPLAMVIRGLSEGERQTITRQLGEAFAGFVADGGYRFPGVSLNAVAS